MIRLVKRRTGSSRRRLPYANPPDHPTPVQVRTHVAHPVPYLLYDSTAPEQHDWHYNEKEAAEQRDRVSHGWDMMKYLFGGELC